MSLLSVWLYKERSPKYHKFLTRYSRACNILWNNYYSKLCLWNDQSWNELPIKSSTKFRALCYRVAETTMKGMPELWSIFNNQFKLSNIPTLEFEWSLEFRGKTVSRYFHEGGKKIAHIVMYILFDTKLKNRIRECYAHFQCTLFPRLMDSGGKKKRGIDREIAKLQMNESSRVIQWYTPWGSRYTNSKRRPFHSRHLFQSSPPQDQSGSITAIKVAKQSSQFNFFFSNGK